MIYPNDKNQILYLDIISTSVIMIISSYLPGTSGGAVLSAGHLHGGPRRFGGLHGAAGAVNGACYAPGATRCREMAKKPGENVGKPWENPWEKMGELS